MIKEAIEKILSLRPIEIHEINGEHYSSGALQFIKKREQESPKSLEFATLSGLLDLLQSGDLVKPLLFHVVDFSHVELISYLKNENANQRFKYAEAKLNYPGFQYQHFYEVEFFIVAVQSLFIPNETTEKLLAVVGNLANYHIQSSNDDGVTQTVQVKTGITTKANVSIENPMKLKPYRTFREVDQPESEFIFRMNYDHDKLKCALFEADGGSWKLKAIESIKSWLTGKIDYQYTVIG